MPNRGPVVPPLHELDDVGADAVEVERAMASLEGRDVGIAADLAVARRDAERKRIALMAAIAEKDEHVAERRRARVRRAVIAAVVVAAGAAAAYRIVPLLRARADERAKAAEAAAPIAAPFLRQGFTEADAADREAPELAIDGQAGRCFVAVGAASGGAAVVKVKREVVAAEGNGSVGFCTCATERVVVSATGPGTVALRVLSAPARAVGGADLLAALSPPPSVTLAETVNRACAEKAIDDWLNAGRSRPAALPPDATLEEVALARVGLAPVTAIAAAVGAVPAATKDACWIARSRAPADRVALRLPLGERAVEAAGAIGFCASDPTGLAVVHTPGAPVVLFSIPSARAGGALGLTEAAWRGGMATLATWVPPDDRAADAKATLAASGAGSAHLLEPGAFAEASLVVLSGDAISGLDAGSPATACRLTTGHSVCVEASPGAWQPLGTPPLATVLARRPAWLPVQSGAPLVPGRRSPSEPLERALDALELARRMNTDGWELTSFAGVSETADGAIVTGRSGEKEVAAVALSASPPYLHVLAPDARRPPGAPPAVPLAAGEKVELHASPAYAGGKREIVVWRR